MAFSVFCMCGGCDQCLGAQGFESVPDGSAMDEQGDENMDKTEGPRRKRLAEINSDPGSREALEATYGKVWDTDQLAVEFWVLGFMAPYVVVERKSDHKKGSLEFQHHPRLYFNFMPGKG